MAKVFDNGNVEYIKDTYKTGERKGQQKESLKSIKDYDLLELNVFIEELNKRIQFRKENPVNYFELAEVKGEEKFIDKVIDKMIEEINKIKKFDDFLCLTQGIYHKRVAENVGLVLAVETGVGYVGTFAKFKAYESEFIRNLLSGANPIHTLDYKDGTNQKLDALS